MWLFIFVVYIHIMSRLCITLSILYSVIQTEDEVSNVVENSVVMAIEGNLVVKM